MYTIDGGKHKKFTILKVIVPIWKILSNPQVTSNDPTVSSSDLSHLNLPPLPSTYLNLPLTNLLTYYLDLQCGWLTVTYSDPKVTYSYPKVTYSDHKVTYSDPKVTHSDPKVTHSDPTHLPLPPPASPVNCQAIS